MLVDKIWKDGERAIENATTFLAKGFLEDITEFLIYQCEESEDADFIEWGTKNSNIAIAIFEKITNGEWIAEWSHYQDVAGDVMRGLSIK